MNGEEFYQGMKDALCALGLGWSEKHKMTVACHIDCVSYTYQKRTYVIHLPPVEKSNELPTAS